MSSRLQSLPSSQDPTEKAGRFARRVTLEDAIGVGHGPRQEQTALLTRAFENQNEVLEHYYGAWVPVAVALIRSGDREKIEFAAAPDVELDQNVEELLFRAYGLYRQVHLTFEVGRDRALLLHMIYGVIAGLFKELDRTAATKQAGCARIAYIEQALDRADGYFRRASQRRAQLRYLGGMTGGLTVIAGLGFLLALGLSMVPEMRDEAPMFLVSLIAGGTGAVISVLFGMTSGNLKLHTLFASAESTLGPLVAAGALRPLLGALSGTVIYVLLKSKLVPLDVPDGAAGTHFVIALAILAGFSERWARGVLAGTEERIQGAGSKPAEKR
jgi:hypothetical protein